MNKWEQEEYERELSYSRVLPRKHYRPAATPEELAEVEARLHLHDAMSGPVSPRMIELEDALRWAKFGTPRYTQLKKDLAKETQRTQREHDARIAGDA